MSYKDIVIEDLRLVVLILLADAGGYALNAYVLHRMLPGLGHHVSLDGLKTQLAWLEEQGLVSLVQDPPLVVATLTDRGLDVSAGNAVAPGVKRRLPGS